MELNSYRVKNLAKIVDRRIGLTKNGQILYVVTGLAFGFVFERPFELHVCKAYHNILIIFIISYTGKLCCQLGYVPSLDSYI